MADFSRMRQGASRTFAAVGMAGVVICSAASVSANGAEHPGVEEERTHGVFIIPGQSVGSLPYEPLSSALNAGGFLTEIVDVKGYDVRSDAAVIKENVERFLKEHPGSDVSLVGHSAGGMSAREYVKTLGGHESIANYIAIGSPQYGSPGACVQSGAARDLCPGSDFLRNLNAGDDTPGSTRYYSIRSVREWADGRLDGGQCRMTPIAPPIPLLNGGFHHSIEPLQPEVIGSVFSALGGVCRGEYVDEPLDSMREWDTIFQNGI